jgi:RNA polymerase sigma-70 factor, ECF subfamily
MLGTGSASSPFYLPMEAQNPPSDVDSNEADYALMVRVGQGDHAAFRELVEKHQHAVVGTVAKMLGNPADAEDIAQQVFLRIWRHARRYRPEAKFTTYLFTITRNLVFNESRRRSRRKEVSSDEREENSHHQIEADPRARPDSELLKIELQEAVDTAINLLPEAQRMAVVLRRYEQMPYEDIASVLGLSVSAVKSLLFRARTTLRESLRNYMDE